MSRGLKWLPEEYRDLQTSRQVVTICWAVANAVMWRVDDVPSHLSLSARAGVGPRGAFSQVMMHGPGALTWEFGNRSRGPRAPLRRALGKKVRI